MAQTYVKQRVQRALEKLKTSPVCPVCMSERYHTHRFEGTGKWIGVDFDGTLAHSESGQFSDRDLGLPVPEMVERVRSWLKAGYPVKVFTARMAPHPSHEEPARDLAEVEARLRAWCREHIGQELECTAQKDCHMEVLWDDRAVGVSRNLGVPL